MIFTMLVIVLPTSDSTAISPIALPHFLPRCTTRFHPTPTLAKLPVQSLRKKEPRMRRGPGRERWDGRLAVEQRPTRSSYHGKSPDGESEDFGKGKKMRRYRSG